MTKPTTGVEALKTLFSAGYQGVKIAGGRALSVEPWPDLRIKANDFMLVPDSSMPKGVFMFGGIPFGYNAHDHIDDDGDVDEVQKLRVKVESLQKTIDRLTRLQTVNPEKTIFVLKLPATEGWSQENHDAFLKLLPAGSVLIALPEEYAIEGLDDRDLQEIGLKRAVGPALTEAQAYDLMLMGYRK